MPHMRSASVTSPRAVRILAIVWPVVLCSWSTDSMSSSETRPPSMRALPRGGKEASSLSRCFASGVSRGMFELRNRYLDEVGGERHVVFGGCEPGPGRPDRDPGGGTTSSARGAGGGDAAGAAGRVSASPVRRRGDRRDRRPPASRQRARVRVRGSRLVCRPPIPSSPSRLSRVSRASRSSMPPRPSRPGTGAEAEPFCVAGGACAPFP